MNATQRLYPVAILAGGLATRLRPITETKPKALIDVASKPFIARQLEFLHAQGVRDVVLCVGYLGEMIQDVVGTGERYGLQVRYSFDGSELLGTGGALKKALPLLGDHFFVLYGDSYLPIDFSAVQDAYVQSSRPALMTVLKNGDRLDKSNVLFVDGKLVEYNKRAPREEMNHVDFGLAILSSWALEDYCSDSAQFDLADVYHDLSMTRQLFGLEVHQRFYEIGSHAGLKEAIDYFISKDKA